MIEKIIMNEEKNGIEIYFNEKPAEEIRNNLKLNGFKWSRYSSCWYNKQSDAAINFANSLKNADTEELKKSSEEYKEEKEEYIKNKLTELNIYDLENYKVSGDLSKRENDVSFFRNKEKNHNAELQGILLEAQSEVLELLKDCNDIYIEYNLKMALQRFKKNYTENYLKMLNHRAQNPSWAVTGRSGLNVNKYNKALDRYDNLMLQSNEIIDNFNAAISKEKNKLRKIKKSELNEKIEAAGEKINNYEFKRIKKSFNAAEVRNIFDNPTHEKIMTTLNGEYFIFKNWGCFRAYNKEGKEIYSTKTTGKLEDAKKGLIYYIENNK